MINFSYLSNATLTHIDRVNYFTHRSEKLFNQEKMYQE